MPFELYNADCLEKMKDFANKSIDMICCDLPYGVLNRGNNESKWDNIIPFEPLWEQYERIIKDNGAIVLFSQGMFTAQLLMSNPKLWRYNLVWDKQRATGFLNAYKMPLRYHEDICVFYKALPTYNPQMEELNGREPSHSQGFGKHSNTNQCYGSIDRSNYTPKPEYKDKKFPKSIISIKREHDNKQVHPTQKPIALMEYLVKTYSNEGDTILDNCMGSGSTGVACGNTNRNFIGIEKEEKYFNIAKNRIEMSYEKNPLKKILLNK
ncbi:MAG: site-specific DNA-methyltransferase [Paludibacteraceae bacterium]|nr:site-specific DNA-methyltransferase [Paludibacteraceae bacterium]